MKSLRFETLEFRMKVVAETTDTDVMSLTCDWLKYTDWTTEMKKLFF